ncbi:MAG: hypothetical protein BM556_07705 [Bacteriovorax sp. MedPE-SWde]|nr:MAG: hypothetical protein BM556_07705 [Bacteriovorax sp. MedPE-SWde]
MKIYCSVSLGELIDKLTILEIKIERINDITKVENAKNEHEQLTLQLNELNLDNKENLSNLRGELKQINEKLWVIEDDIRLKESDNVFDQEFIDLARSVYITNDQRFEVKNSINMGYNSEIKEVKSYKG